MSNASLIEISDLTTSVRTARGELPVVTGFDLTIERGETVAIIGESGCGKSLTALSITGLLPRGQARVTAGSIRLDGEELVGLPERELAKRRGRDLAMIFQDPMSALNPVMTIGAQIEEAIRAHLPLPRQELRARAIELLRMVQIPDPVARMDEYPHRLSGGMCQRIAIAIAIACEPRLLIADEPTTALDVTIQAQVLQLLRDLKQATGMAMLFITHDFGVVAQMADRVVVMYAGRKVEEGSVRQILTNPRHPYTAGLLALTMSPGKPRPRHLPEIKGMVPALHARPDSCQFAPRCALASDICHARPPLSVRGADAHEVACWANEHEGNTHVVALRR